MLTLWNVIWFILIFVVISGYFILDGFDLGVGALYPFLGKDEVKKATLRRAIGPTWDGNEVWLLTGGGALFAAFAPAYATTFSGYYIAIMLVLFCLIVRAVSLETRGHDPERAKFWDALFFLGSALPALLFGVAVGDTMMGIPMDAQGNMALPFPISFVFLLRPFALLCGLVGLMQFLLLGACWIAVKTEGELHDTAVALRPKFALAEIVLFVLASVLWFVGQGIDPQAGVMGAVFGIAATPSLTIVSVVFAVVALAGMALTYLWSNKGEADLKIFIVAAVICLGLCFTAAFGMFPNWVPDSLMANPVTVAEAASEDFTLIWMFGITIVGLPILLFYHFLCYRAFAGKITEADLEY